MIVDGFDKAKKFTYAQLTDEFGYNFDQCGYPHEEEEILDPLDLIQKYEEQRASLNAKIDRVLAESPRYWEAIKMSNNLPVEENKGDIVIYRSGNGDTKIDVHFQDETVWLTQAQLCELYQSSKANVSEHIKNILRKANWRKIQLFGKSEQLPRTENHTL